jgi:hypothetical protein
MEREKTFVPIDSKRKRFVLADGILSFVPTMLEMLADVVLD